MKLLRIKDNSQQKKDAFSQVAKLTGKIADKTLEQLEREGVFVFPETVKDAEDITQDQMILQSVNDTYRSGNVMGFLGYGDERLAIASRFCGEGEDYLFQYLLDKVLDFLFVQLICDFIKSEIGHRTNILSTGDSAALSIMACSNSPELFDQIMLINPSSLTDCCQLPGKNAKLYKLLLDLPLAGTLIYHIACSRSMIEEAFRTKYFYNPYTVKPVQIDRSHEAAHLGECPKAIFSSIECRYTKCNISNALRKIDNSIFIIGGSEEPMIEATIQDYKIYNSAIESSIIPKTKHLPQLEQPDAVMDAIHMFFS